MPLSVPYIVFVAKQLEIQELKRLKTRSHLVGVIGQMVHVLQSERGASSIFLASSGKRFESTRLQLIRESKVVENSLRNKIESELDYSTHSNAKIISLMAWVLLGLDALPELRKRVTEQQLSGGESVAAFSRLIAGLISLIFELADAALDELEDALGEWGIGPAPEDGPPPGPGRPGTEFAERVAGKLAFTAAQCAQQLSENDLAAERTVSLAFQPEPKLCRQAGRSPARPRNTRLVQRDEYPRSAAVARRNRSRVAALRLVRPRSLAELHQIDMGETQVALRAR